MSTAGAHRREQWEVGHGSAGYDQDLPPVRGSYDVVFGPVFHPGRKDAVRIANDRPGQRILEVGVGTGLSLPYFRTDAEVTGIDVSAEMLAKARRRVARRALTQVKAILEMDAENMSSPTTRSMP